MLPQIHTYDHYLFVIKFYTHPMENNSCMPQILIFSFDPFAHLFVILHRIYETISSYIICGYDRLHFPHAGE